MKKLLILKNEISSYNVPVYNILSEHYDLTVGYYTKDKSKQDCLFKKKCFRYTTCGPFIFIKGLKNYVKSFDVVSFVPDMHVVSYCLLPYLHRNYKVVSWSIGFRVSYVHPYVTTRRHTFADRIFQSILAHSDASIFYMDKAKEFWNDTSLNLKNIFVAPNTSEVLEINMDVKRKNNFLFVGTLYKKKGIDLLLKAYKDAIDNSGIENKLHIVGDGEERYNIEEYVKKNHLEERVVLHGAIFDEHKLAELFSEALLCISPTQGGLSVPKSMGYGVPFVTKTTAITGGEVYHITPNENGIIYEKNEDLSNILVDAGLNPKKYIVMGIKSKEYYDNNATIGHMASGAMRAFEYVLSL